ncbi:hypothetical protein PA35_06512 [Pseudomonas aeruginosa]|nr:hypothetical protein PA37_06442 [Pseudomonas aeruginosa]RCM57830.1 hypothetical protein PA33_06454 [Pseudomonas aeruginosa]RCM60623.1 hypothetical protein PA31_06534 [Pseudomonas aeruginosa]RCM70552.1 hypothetical protein PA35_06512 [Pseudomonas aeruginosa]RCN17157.1 hypothetical protein PA32_06529 [Pseudomonas aeruginosa]
MLKRTLYHFHFCCGLGGGAAGFNRARPRVGNVEAEWVCLGGIDVDPAGLRDFERLAGVPGTLLDLFTHDQYVRFHGKEPPAAAEAIAGVMGTTLLLAEAGETFMLSNTPIWVRPVAVALSVSQPAESR